MCFTVQFSCSVVSDSLWTHESQHARPPCPSPTPRAYSNPCPPSQQCHPTISSSVVPFSSCPQSLPASASFPMSQLFTRGGQSIGASASASVTRPQISRHTIHFTVHKTKTTFCELQNFTLLPICPNWIFKCLQNFKSCKKVIYFTSQRKCET